MTPQEIQVLTNRRRRDTLCQSDQDNERNADRDRNSRSSQADLAKPAAPADVGAPTTKSLFETIPVRVTLRAGRPFVYQSGRILWVTFDRQDDRDGSEELRFLSRSGFRWSTYVQRWQRVGQPLTVGEMTTLARLGALWCADEWLKDGARGAARDALEAGWRGVIGLLVDRVGRPPDDVRYYASFAADADLETVDRQIVQLVNAERSKRRRRR